MEGGECRRKKKENQQEALGGSLHWMDMIDMDYGAVCNWWVTAGERWHLGEGESVCGEEVEVMKEREFII